MTYPSWDEIRNSVFARARWYPMIDGDTPTFMARPFATSPADLKGADVVIIGAPYVASWQDYAGLGKGEWIAGPKRVRQQSIRYASGYIQDFDLDVFDHLTVVDFGDADIPAEAHDHPTAANILRAQAAVEEKVNYALDVGAIPIVLGQNSPLGSYAIVKPIAERTNGNVGLISLDAHWDAWPFDKLTMDPRIAGSGNWKRKVYEFHDNTPVRNLVEIGERGLLESKDVVRDFLSRGAHFYPMWKVRTELGVEGLCKELRHAYEDTKAVYVHFDMDVLGGAGPASGDILGDNAEPIGMSEYEVIRVAHEIGRRGVTGVSFICIPPGSVVSYRSVVYVIMYLLAGVAITRRDTSRPAAKSAAAVP